MTSPDDFRFLGWVNTRQGRFYTTPSAGDPDEVKVWACSPAAAAREKRATGECPVCLTEQPLIWNGTVRPHRDDEKADCQGGLCAPAAKSGTAAGSIGGQT